MRRDLKKEVDALKAQVENLKSERIYASMSDDAKAKRAKWILAKLYFFDRITESEHNLLLERLK